MSYSFESLSPADFEDLSRDLIGCELGVRFEAFGPGPDGGVDGRHSEGPEAIVLQAKHYRMSTFALLHREIARERASIDKLAPGRYVLSTSRPLTPKSKEKLAQLIGPSLAEQGDIFSAGDLNGLIRKYPEIEKSHVKLWLSGAGVIERVLQAATENFTSLTKQDIVAKLRVYAENPSFKSGRDILEAHRVLVVSGPPGVGKTTLAEMLSYAYIGEDWELIAIRSLEEGFAKIADSRKQVFFFDDFLGRIALDARALSRQDSELARFISRVRRTPGARFILTTRAYIYEEARRVSESLADQRLDVSKYVLDVGIYTRRIKARILYNHLLVAEVPAAHIRSLVRSKNLKRVIDHKNYNPRIIEWMTDGLRVGDIRHDQYPQRFLAALDNPSAIWDTAFRTHISRRCQHLLIALYFCSEYGVEMEDVREAFHAVHTTLSSAFGIPLDPKDFEEALKTLEGGFVAISKGSVSFVNPSVRDYLNGYLADGPLLTTLALAAPNSRWAERLFDQFSRLPQTSKSDWAAFLERLLPLSGRLNAIPMWKPIATQPGSFRSYDNSRSRRVELLVTWWRRSGNGAFLSAATEVARQRRDYSGFDDARKIPELIADLRSGSGAQRNVTEELEEALAAGLIDLIRASSWPDDLERVLGAVEAHREVLPPEVDLHLDVAINGMIDEIDSMVNATDSESTLSDYATALKRLAERASIDAHRVARAEQSIERRMEELREEETTDNDLSFAGGTPFDDDDFDDDELRNLFAPLAGPED